MIESEIKLYQNDDHATAGNTPAGTPVSDPLVEIDTSTVGEWLPKLVNNGIGSVQQHRLAYVGHTNATDTLSAIKVSQANAISSHSGGSTATGFKIVSSSALDDNTKKVRVWGDGATEDVVLNGTTEVDILGTYPDPFIRLQLLTNDVNEDPVNAHGDIQFTAVTSGFNFATIPSGYDIATSEFRLGADTTPHDYNDVIVWSTARTGVETVSLAIPAAPGAPVGVWCQQTSFPGVDTADIRIAFRIEGEST